jgi:hypothetical protein
MLGFSPKLPIGDDERQWVDEGFRRLEKLSNGRSIFPPTSDRTSTDPAGGWRRVPTA